MFALNNNLICDIACPSNKQVYLWEPIFFKNPLSVNINNSKITF